MKITKKGLALTFFHAVSWSAFVYAIYKCYHVGAWGWIIFACMLASAASEAQVRRLSKK